MSENLGYNMEKTDFTDPFLEASEPQTYRKIL